jgi:hypothetical protein
MKNNNADKVLMEKLGSLDTLSGGIVYGREEAWEKLQGRLDARPAKRIVLKYSLAATVLVLLGITGFYFYPTKENVNAKTQIAKSVTSQPVPAAATPKTETTALYTSVNRKETRIQKRNGLQVSHTSRVWDTSVAAEPKTPVAPVVVIQTSPATAAPKPMHMKVVHINELNSEDEPQNVQQNIAASTTALDVRKLPKVHINDVVHEEYEIEKLRRENRLGTGNQFFLWRDRSSLNENTSNDNSTEYQPLNKQRFRIN